ncbi:MAG: NAD(P)-dependent oxidoreductase [Dysgonamonadaceae bacterium]|nr:NAD(P)-dependent oxidoreductase [Dysgonamonadaceae bacterium]MDD3357310.1 NAD(P)-dependent oxidoreductase [Dysgonamonadaceae bacterium]MDD3728542.1 NAD(P)-dependent oxidoreductase [Dysgonamonadaceae bacterium]MDD4606210.1 NAD(P)-dependent oxidoreductase [Dysgonamonadaceae bacterium]
MKTRKRILLTGAAGTVGQAVLKELCTIKNRYEVTVFDIKSSKTIKKFNPFREEINIVYGDIENENDLIKVCHDKDVVIHLAAIIPPLADEKPKLSYQVNVKGTEKLIRLLEQHSPKAFFLYSSSISVYGDRLNNPLITINDKLNPSEGDEYAKTKILAEDIIQSCKLDWTIFRLTAIMGGHKISKLMFHQPLKTSLEIASPEDTARAFVNAIDKQAQLSKKIFNLGGGQNCRIIYDDFLSRSFKIYGLGKLDFPPKTFAEKNFHCGYYEDGYVLDNILNFRKDTLFNYFENQKKDVSIFKKLIISIFHKPIKKYLQSQSEPLRAYINQDIKSIEHYLKSDT